MRETGTSKFYTKFSQRQLEKREDKIIKWVRVLCIQTHKKLCNIFGFLRKYLPLPVYLKY